MAADKELLDVLLKNGIINKAQYEALLKKGGDVGGADLLTILQKNGAITKEQYATLSKKQAAPAKAEAKHEEKEAAHVKLGEKGLEIESDDDNFKASFGGRLQLDSQINWNEKHTPRTAQLDDGVGIRRGRIHFEGTVYKDYDFKVEYDFARGNGSTAAGLTDFYIRYQHFKPFSITAGQFKEPFSLESVGSNRFLTFIERSLPNNAFIEFGGPYELGLSLESYGKLWTVRGAIQTEPVGAGFSNTTSTNSNGNSNRNNFSGNTSWSVTGRATFLPIYNSPTQLVHVGVGGSYRELNNTFNANGTLRSGGMTFASQPDTDVDRTNWVNTGNLTTSNGSKILDHFTRFGAELATVFGPFSIQSEYMRTQLTGKGYDSNDVLEGYYAYASYFLTGESRNYNTKEAKFDRLKVNRNFDFNGGWGAWEIAARWDYLDMNTRHVSGGRIENGTLAINWYLNPRVRFMANYVHVFNVRTFADNASIAQFNGLNPDILMFRTQIDW
ncbi:OprO/OprP family phosphate-selective porin [Candidatus Methylocalor cossyra]|uniref:Phosphate-specific outer membrane porin OprP Pyrophosphate-specific outer membrane porin OprO n=1 Tax=Candidatus Methylocalor cossyra TaxID=3108543 RepID=A0ABM9NKG2_9GAMM